MHAFSGHEHEQGLLPCWVLDAVTKGQYAVPVSNAKLSFSLVPALSSHLPALERSRLTAPVILEVRLRCPRSRRCCTCCPGAPPVSPTVADLCHPQVRKVVHYVRDRLREQKHDVDVAEITFSDADNAATWLDTRTHLLQITCNGKLVPFNMTLNTVKRYLCTGRADDDIPLKYSLVDRANPVPLPRIVPKEQLANH